MGTKTNDEITYAFEDEPMAIHKNLMSLLLSQRKEKGQHPCDLIALYMFYYYTAKWQRTNQPKAVDKYVRGGVMMGLGRFRKAQRKLIELGLIEKICRKNEKGRIMGWYIKVNFIYKKNTLGKFQLSSSLIIDDPRFIGNYNDFQKMRNNEEHIKIYERDNYTCSYCGATKLIEIKQLYKEGKSQKEIAEFVSENPKKIATIDHIVSLFYGGGNEESNLTTACLSCNSKKNKNVHVDENVQMDEIPSGSFSTSGETETNALSSYNKNALSSSSSKNSTPSTKNPKEQKQEQKVCNPETLAKMNEILVDWNTFAILHKKQSLRALTTDRKRLLSDRLGEEMFDFKTILAECLKSPWLMGKEKSKGSSDYFHLTFDRLIRDDFYIKILEGTYSSMKSIKLNVDELTVPENSYSLEDDLNG